MHSFQAAAIALGLFIWALAQVVYAHAERATVFTANKAVSFCDWLTAKCDAGTARLTK